MPSVAAAKPCSQRTGWQPGRNPRRLSLARFPNLSGFARAAASSELPAEERSLWEAAIQLDLVTVRTAEAQVAQGTTLAAWVAWQQPGAGVDCKGHAPTTGDKALLLALGMFNLVVLVSLAAAVVWVFGLI